MKKRVSMRKCRFAATAAKTARLILVVSIFTAASAIATAQTASNPPPGYHPYAGSDEIVAAYGRQSQSVTLDVIGGQGNVNSGFNFNGFANGDMIVEVPEGWKVSVNFTVDSSLSHSIVVAPWSERQAGSFTEAFGGAAIADSTSGIHKGDPAAHFSFVASSSGKYAMVCAVPGHDALGMWDELDVVGGLEKPEVLVK